MAKGKTNYPSGGTDTSDATAGAGDIVSPKTAYGSAGTKLTGTITEKVGSATVITPSTSDQTIPAGRYGGAAGDGKVLGDADLVAANIKTGVNIFGVNGSCDPAPTSMETETYFAAGSYNIYYRKFGKLYVFGEISTPGLYVGGDSTTIARICTILGITESANYTYRNNSTAYYWRWNGSAWFGDSGTTSAKRLCAILAA